MRSMQITMSKILRFDTSKYLSVKIVYIKVSVTTYDMWIAWCSGLWGMLTTGLYVWGAVFEASGGNRVQEVINHHNSASLPRVKQRQKEKKRRRRGDMKGSPTSMPRREEGGGRREEKRSRRLPWKFYFRDNFCHVVCMSSSTCDLSLGFAKMW